MWPWTLLLGYFSLMAQKSKEIQKRRETGNEKGECDEDDEEWGWR